MSAPRPPSSGNLRSEPAADSAGATFYVAADKIYPREITGRFARMRNVAVGVLLGLYYGVAWVQWDGHQALLFDLPHRKFYIFGLTLWPQDFFYLTLLLILAALSLFFVTSLAGRLWCGYACPQTVWTELFIRIEQWTEGTRSKRMKLDQGPWTRQKLLRKGGKQFLWIALSLFTGFTFVGYFTPIRELGGAILSLSLGPWAAFWVLFYSFATYGNAGHLREQVCKYMCPYARFQSAMFDKDTLIISYDEKRGEPRGGRPRGTDPRAQGLGDCIDCTLCVQVCPTGIDIRQGLQYECIACAACIDTCDDVMDKMGTPRGLIRYTTEHALHGAPTRVVRPRVIIYACILIAVAATLVVSLVTRTPLILDVIRDRNALYREVRGDRIENAYTLRLINLDDAPHAYRLEVAGLDEAELVSPTGVIEAQPGEVSTIAARVQAPSAVAHGVHPITLSLAAVNAPDIAVEEKTRFLGPQP